ncbi:hypothetical protein P775_08465 [Puniceibacterium antarcticum]|uniref:Major tropism determinant N-terminal domain-containing protein n=1 Tax=Puniceibacterium antarcticum TaxID=1206336 RepID=A0A2G8RGC9_9RHOB|nr:hypothetical protein [Puniceibacterium antarcticum]PIL20553.1 hypothetical protein P775_08465 [Puniceibacterium antarcticum]
MAKELQYRRGTSAMLDSAVGAFAEVQVDVQSKELRVFDGETPGGFPIGRKPFLTARGMLDSPEGSRGLGAAWEAGEDKYTEVAADDPDYDVEKTGGIRLINRSDVYQPIAFGWTDGDDIAPYIEQFWAGRWTIFVGPQGNSYPTLTRRVELDTDDVTTFAKRFHLDGCFIQQTSDTACIVLESGTAGPSIPKVQVYGGDTILFSDASIGWDVMDIRRTEFHKHTVWGSLINASQGTAWRLHNKNAYTERTKLIDCEARYVRHAVNFHMAGGEDGGLSFARTYITNMTLSGGVSGYSLIAITTEVEASLAVAAANDYTIGEVITQASSGATAVVSGWPEGRDTLFVRNIVGTFGTGGPVVGATSAASKTPSNVITPRLPNVYDSRIVGITANMNDGVIFMDLGGGMRGTRIANLGFEASPGTTAYVFKHLNNWTFVRPQIELPDIFRAGYSGNIALNYNARTSKSNWAAHFWDGLRLFPSDFTPDTLEGTISMADGVGWNPGSVGTPDGAKGIFAYIGTNWRRFMMLLQAAAADFSNDAALINTASQKHLGAMALDTTFSRMRIATGASAASSWAYLSSPPFGVTASRPASPVVGEHYYDQTLAKPIWWSGSVWKDAAGTNV